VQYAAVYPDLAADDYTIWRDATTVLGVVTIEGGHVTSLPVGLTPFSASRRVTAAGDPGGRKPWRRARVRDHARNERHYCSA